MVFISLTPRTLGMLGRFVSGLKVIVGLDLETSDLLNGLIVISATGTAMVVGLE